MGVWILWGVCGGAAVLTVGIAAFPGALRAGGGECGGCRDRSVGWDRLAVAGGGRTARDSRRHPAAPAAMDLRVSWVK